MGTIDDAIDGFIHWAIRGFLVLGVVLLGLSALRGLDLELLFMSLGSFAWVGLLLLTIQPWRK